MSAEETIRKAVALIEQSQLPPEDKALMEVALRFHGHVCPAMPAAFRAGRTALRTLGLERERNSVAHLYAETGRHHAAGCVVDGLQAATGCTYGKDNISKLGYGKWSFVLVAGDGRAVRVGIRTEVMEKNFTSPFIEERKKGILPSEVNPEFSLRVFAATLERREEDFFDVSPVFTYRESAPKPETCFHAIRCQECGELVAENYIRYKRGRLLCIPCSGYGPSARGGE